MVVFSSKDIHFGVKREHTHVASRLRKRISSIGDRDPVLRLGVQGIEVVVISRLSPRSTKDIEVFLDDSTSMSVSFTWWITCNIYTLEDFAVDIIRLDIILITTITKTTEQINRPRN